MARRASGSCGCSLSLLPGRLGPVARARIRAALELAERVAEDAAGRVKDEADIRIRNDAVRLQRPACSTTDTTERRVPRAAP